MKQKFETTRAGGVPRPAGGHTTEIVLIDECVPGFSRFLEERGYSAVAPPKYLSDDAIADLARTKGYTLVTGDYGFIARWASKPFSCVVLWRTPIPTTKGRNPTWSPRQRVLLHALTGVAPLELCIAGRGGLLVFPPGQDVTKEIVQTEYLRRMKEKKRT